MNMGFSKQASLEDDNAEIESTTLNNTSYVNKKKELGDEFMEILQKGDIRTVFQPIISLKDGELLGYEALSRGPEESVFKNPEKLFEYARIFGRLWELELLCRLKALESISRQNPYFQIFLNVDPHIINDELFKKGFTKDFISQFKINPDNIVFEITEKNSVTDVTTFKKAIENYKCQGYKIAIDDTGSGYSGLKLITDIHPHYIKLDMNLIRNIDKDGLKYALIKTFYDFSLVTDIKLIAEGIETENELNALVDIGVDYGQGYFIQKPLESLPPIEPGLKKLIISHNRKKRELYINKSATVFVGDICRKSITVNSSCTGSGILEIFSNDFKVYNDIYGFENGDRLLQYLASLLTSSFSECSSNCFIGHIGGDDFIVAFESYEVEEKCQYIIEEFDRNISSFYSDLDINRGYILSKNRRGEDEKFGMVGISIAGITNKYRSFKNIYELSEYSSKIKKRCKIKCCSCFIIE